VLATEIVTGIAPAERTPRQVEREFRALLAGGCRLRPAGDARREPESLLALGYAPKHAIRLFDATFYLTNFRYDDDINFFVAYVRLPGDRSLYPRIFYKDISLVWRTATHVVRTADENWIGKGELKWCREADGWCLYSAEETTNLPLEIQSALDTASRRVKRPPRDLRAVELVLRRAPAHRVAPYEDFAGPRRRARARRGDRVHGGRPVAWFERPGNPASLRFAPGFAPDFAKGVLEVAHSRSRLYGGDVHKYRILSRNRGIQYQFLAAPRHVWIVPPQTLTRELMSYGVRTVDVVADEDLFVPGYEYHFLDDSLDPPVFHSQIPAGFAGAASEVDPARADASRWLDALPVVQEFRKAVRPPA
jgi:hypothetical protein